MSDERRSKYSSEGKSDRSQNSFIRETIKNSSESGGIGRKILRTILLGILFGAAAAVGFAAVGRPLQYFGHFPDHSAEAEVESVSISRDEESVTGESLPEETAEETTEFSAEDHTYEEESSEEISESAEGAFTEEASAEEASAAEEESSQAGTESEAEETDVTPEETESAAAVTEKLMDIAKVQEIISDFQNSMVTVASLSADEDVFDQTFVHSQETFGVVLAVTRTDVRILTESYLLEDADIVRIMLPDRKTYDANLIGMDRTTGIACVSIPLSSVAESSLDVLKPVVLGNSYMLQPGDLVVAMGDPMGYVPSVGWGIVSYIEKDYQGTDIVFQLIQTDIAGDTDARGFLVNQAGEVVGWIRQDYNSDNMKHILAALSVSDIKGYLETISNGGDLTQIGIRLQEITREMSEEQNIPRGLYITRSIIDGPAYNAGIQNGDIIVQLGGISLYSMEDLQTALSNYAPGETVKTVVKRRGRSGFTEHVFDVELASR